MAEKEATLADPAALGLAAFGATTVLLNLHNLDLTTATLTFAYGFFFGGLAQVIAGIIDFKRNNIFGGTAFTSYGLFWIGLSLLKLFEWEGLVIADTSEIAAWMAIWGIFTLYMTAGSFKVGGRALQVVFVTLTILFFLLSAAFATGEDLLFRIAGAEGVFCGLSALYTSAGVVLNSVYGKRVLPL
ncbi:MAG: acetate uptake transporter [Candidatus Hadarchaeales archaeon]